MYYYISFLRPPPTEASIGVGYVLITPQIANDLRTELFSDTTDILYSWSPYQGFAETDSASCLVKTTRPAKLITWSPLNAYKELKVPLPPAARYGSSWRLVLSSSAVHGHHLINLGYRELGVQPLPVASMPISFTRHPLMKAVKQDEIERLFTFPSAYSENPLIVREQTSFDLDKVGTQLM